MADTRNDLWLQITAESDIPDDITNVDLGMAKELIRTHNESAEAHADIRTKLQELEDAQVDEIKEYSSKRDFPASGDTSVTIYVDVSTGNLYRYNTSSRKYEALAMDTIPPSVALEGVPTAPTARLGTNTQQVATTQFVQNELAQLREQQESVTPVYYDGKTKAKLSLLGANGTIITNVADGKVEEGSSDAVTGGQLWSAQRDMSNMSALAARNIAANAAEIDLLKRRAATVVQIEGTNLDVALAEKGDTRTFTLAIPENGTVTEEETKFVTGKTVYQAIQDAKGYISGGAGITVTDGVVAIDDTVATKEDVENAAFSNQFKIINGDHTAAMLGEAEGQPTYAINVRANGSIQKNDGRIITGGVVYEEVRLDENGHFIRENNTAAQNIAVLDDVLFAVKSQLDDIPGALELRDDLTTLQETTDALAETEAADKAELIAKIDAEKETLQDSIDAIEEREAGYLDKDLAGLSEDGTQVIRDVVDSRTVKIVNGDHTTATLGEENGQPTYAINVRATGRIQSGDGRIVTAQTIYQEVRPQTDGTNVATAKTVGENLLALDAAVSGINNRVSDVEENLVVHTAGDYITIADDGKISVNVSGSVTENNTGLVTGDQITDAIQDSEARTGLLIKDVHDEMLDRINEARTIGAGEGISVSENTVSVVPELLEKINNAASTDTVYTKEEVDALIPEDTDTQYVLSKDDETNELILTTSDGTEVSRIQLATDTDTKYSLEKVGNTIRLIPNNDPTQAIPIELDADINTTYAFALNEDGDLVITPDDNTAPTVIPLGTELDKKVDKAELENYVPWTDISTEDNPNRDAIVLKNHDGLFGTTSKGNTELLAMVSKWDVADFGNPNMRTNLNTDNVVTVNDAQIVVTDKNLGEFIKAGDGISLQKQTVTVDPSTGFTADIFTVSSDAYSKTELDETLASYETRITQLEEAEDQDTVYTAGNGIKISPENKISVENRVERQILSNGNEALIFNESDGGGAKFTNAAKNTVSFVGVNDGSNNIDVQIYAKDRATNTGTRINVNKNGAYYTVKNSMAFTAEDEIATKRDLNQTAPVFYDSVSNFPNPGENGKIYVDTDTNSLYRWDPVDEKYKEIQGNTINDCIMDIAYADGTLTATKADGSVVTVTSSLRNEDIDTLFN